MPQTISPDLVRTCKLCGQEFHPTARKQFCCNEMKPRRCECCGNEFLSLCSTANTKTTCSKECQVALIKKKREASAASAVKVCKWCGKEFHPTSARQVYCNEIHYQTCSVCGKQFVIDVRIDPYVKTCSNKCRYKQMTESQDREMMKQHLQETMQERYGVSNPMELQSSKDKIKQTNLERYGSISFTGTDAYMEKVKSTCIEKYGVDHHLKSNVVIEKRRQTVQEKYNSDNIFSSDYGKARVKQVMWEKYGVINPSQNAEMKTKATRNSRRSKLEDRISKILDNYRIEYIQHYFISSEQLSHEFDFYIPKYKLLLDADGLYFHSYLDDPDGVRIRDDYDEVRLKLVPADHIFHVIVENNEDKQIKELIDLLESIDGNILKYDSQLFNWCRSIEFPYPDYSDKRIKSDWSHLNSYSFEMYMPQCRIAMSAIKQFHKSIYSCHVGNNLSPIEGWYDDNKLKQVIRNRLIYKNNVDPSKILSGFNISKICPCISIFNPVLAKYLVTKYLNKYSVIFDPFSGFSGRMLGTVASGKEYIGQDINEVAVDESQNLIEFLQLSEHASVITKDIFESSGTYECLLTCPPYAMKEIYGSETTFKTCDGWIDECLTRFDCNRYVFVVDHTDKYSDSITETISSESHLNKTTEYVVVIDKEI